MEGPEITTVFSFFAPGSLLDFFPKYLRARVYVITSWITSPHSLHYFTTCLVYFQNVKTNLWIGDLYFS
jgi:hypothetical protein